MGNTKKQHAVNFNKLQVVTVISILEKGKVEEA